MTLGVGEQGTPTTKLSYMFLFLFFILFQVIMIEEICDLKKKKKIKVYTINLKIYYIYILKKS